MLLIKGLMLCEENVANLEYIQRKIAMVFALLAFGLLLLLGISDFLLNMSPVIIWVKIGISFPFLAAYFIVSKYGKIQIALNILLLFVHVVICITFFYNEGNNGSTIYAFFLMLVISSLLINGLPKILWFIGSLSLYLFLFYAEFQGYIEVANFYGNFQNQYLHHAVTIIWISVFVFLMLHFFTKTYQNQNQVLNEIKQRQDQALEEVKMLNDQKNRLIAILSHDLKNPIGMLHMTLNLVDKDFFEPGEMEQILRNLKGQSFHLNKVLNNTLSWVMTELEDIPAQLHQMSLLELTEEMKEMMLEQANEKNQTIEVSIKGKDQIVPLEINEIRIILKNLLDNAIKFAPINTTIQLILEVSNDKISWSVHNEGATISPADQKELFSFRARTSYGTNKEKGTGVGLALCKRIADKINFNLSYSSSGTMQNCFTLTKKLTKESQLLNSTLHVHPQPKTAQYLQFWKGQR